MENSTINNIEGKYYFNLQVNNIIDSADCFFV